MKKVMVTVLSSVILTTAVAPSISAATVAPKPVAYSIVAQSVPTTVTYQGSQVSVQSLPTSMLKKLIVNGLRYGGELLGDLLKIISKDGADWIKKNSSKAADFLDKLTEWQTEPIKLGLVALGLSPADALLIAEWIVLFIGL
ncbi:hypothetical protein [Paenibacillus alvei]|uniref:Secreted protein n=1 Tax=Paenibacillus alvei TaxID=44250 RepID=A0AAP6ZXK6_PAEAL|nr:hypothetical protein [Paenibacillus alvei]MCY7484244.1 hypothetical protein [Paenibacillus alvei]MCY9581887.1 hypothetical protein [Paenibacillus alvei]MCY9586779.1 hypothetical protein [Paenibacillus alvei]NOJ71531.1 hypothetical protein [Paenibacillus alvei]